jgi:hypothetical protein
MNSKRTISCPNQRLSRSRVNEVGLSRKTVDPPNSQAAARSRSNGKVNCNFAPDTFLQFQSALQHETAFLELHTDSHRSPLSRFQFALPNSAVF